MFNYYGSKSRIARRYPIPRYDRIIEPFAGAAHYSYFYSNKDVVLIEKNQDIYRLWKWLIEEAKEKDILNLQEPARGEDIKSDTFEGTLLISLHCVCGSVGIRKRAGTMEGAVKNWPKKKLRLVEGLSRIRHWTIIQGDFKEYPNEEATWFIDPPYQRGGNFYPTDPIDYQELSKFVMERNGQTIVCEMEGANWLPFRDFTFSKTIHTKRREVIWTNYSRAAPSETLVEFEGLTP